MFFCEKILTISCDKEKQKSANWIYHGKLSIPSFSLRHWNGNFEHESDGLFNAHMEHFFYCLYPSLSWVLSLIPQLGILFGRITTIAKILSFDCSFEISEDEHSIELTILLWSDIIQRFW